jgi:hypothetical protein
MNTVEKEYPDICAGLMATTKSQLNRALNQFRPFKAVGEVDTPWSVASMVQRLGRFGRNEADAQIMRMNTKGGRRELREF